MRVTFTIDVSVDQRRRLAKEMGLDASAHYMAVYTHFRQLVRREQQRLDGKHLIKRARRHDG